MKLALPKLLAPFCLCVSPLFAWRLAVILSVVEDPMKLALPGGCSHLSPLRLSSVRSPSSLSPPDLIHRVATYSHLLHPARPLRALRRHGPRPRAEWHLCYSKTRPIALELRRTRRQGLRPRRALRLVLAGDAQVSRTPRSSSTISAPLSPLPPQPQLAEAGPHHHRPEGANVRITGSKSMAQRSPTRSRSHPNRHHPVHEDRRDRRRHHRLRLHWHRGRRPRQTLRLRLHPAARHFHRRRPIPHLVKSNSSFRIAGTVDIEHLPHPHQRSFVRRVVPFVMGLVCVLSGCSTSRLGPHHNQRRPVHLGNPKLPSHPSATTRLSPSGNRRDLPRPALQWAPVRHRTRSPCQDPGGMVLSVASSTVMAVAAVTRTLCSLRVHADGSLSPLAQSPAFHPFPGILLDGTDVFIPPLRKAAAANGAVARVRQCRSREPGGHRHHHRRQPPPPGAWPVVNPSYLAIAGQSIYIVAGSESSPEPLQHHPGHGQIRHVLTGNRSCSRIRPGRSPSRAPSPSSPYMTPASCRVHRHLPTR